MVTPLPTSARDDRGFTLTEMLVVVMLMGTLISVMYLVMNSTSTWANRVDARGMAAREVRLTADQMSRDLRQASEISEGDGVFAEASPRRCSFYVDLEHDGLPEKITYYVAGNRVLRTVAAATQPTYPYNFGADGPPTMLIGILETGWTGDIFDYFNTSGVEVTSIPTISSVRIHIKNQAVAGNQISTVDSTTWVKIRSVHNSISMRSIEENHDG